MNKKLNIFDFATRELSTSAFYAWLISCLNNEYDVDGSVKDVSLRFINLCLSKTRNDNLSISDIENVEVRKEYKIDKNNTIDVYAEISTYSSGKIHLFIENKTRSNETKKNQLKIYTESLKRKLPSKNLAMVYLKSEFDFDDPLMFFDKDTGNIIPKGDFKKVNWKDLYGVFSQFSESENNIVRDFSRKIIKTSERIMIQLQANDVSQFNFGSHVGQYCFIRKIFNGSLGNNPPLHTDGPNIFFSDDKVIMFGNSFGSSWSLYKPLKYWSEIGFRIEKLTNGFVLRVGVYASDKNIGRVKEKYDIFWEAVNDIGVDFIERQKLNLKRRTIYFGKCLIENLNIDQLNKLDSIADSYAEKLARINR